MFLRPILLLLAMLTASAAQAGPAVGFQHFRTPAGVEIGIWYPADAEAAAPRQLELYSQLVVDDAPVAGRGHALVVMSHGNGGSYSGHYDTAIALARAGFVVAALTHPGDNWQDQSRAIQIGERPPALSALISYMLDDWTGRTAIDHARIGAFGFSAGGFTVLAAAGGVPNLTLLAAHCRAHASFFDCGLLARSGATMPPAPMQWRRDARIKAVVVAAPALGFTFAGKGLAGVNLPVQLWAAADDRILPPPFYAEAVRDALPRTPDYHVEPGAGHFDFLAPCTPALAAAVPAICTSAPGFDRAAFHARFNAEVVRFFLTELARR